MSGRQAQVGVDPKHGRGSGRRSRVTLWPVQRPGVEDELPCVQLDPTHARRTATWIKPRPGKLSRSSWGSASTNGANQFVCTRATSVPCGTSRQSPTEDESLHGISTRTETDRHHAASLLRAPPSHFAASEACFSDSATRLGRMETPTEAMSPTRCRRPVGSGEPIRLLRGRQPDRLVLGSDAAARRGERSPRLGDVVPDPLPHLR